MWPIERKVVPPIFLARSAIASVVENICSLWVAGLEWSCVDLEKGEIHVEKQFTHESWADLKTVNSRRRVPIARELLKELTLHRARIPGLLVFPGPCGAPMRYHNWHSRVWAPLLKRSGVAGNFHMLRAGLLVRIVISEIEIEKKRDTNPRG